MKHVLFIMPVTDALNNLRNSLKVNQDSPEAVWLI